MSNFGEDALNAESADFLFKTTIKITKLLIFNGADATSKTTGTADAFPIGAGLSPIDVARTCGRTKPGAPSSSPPSAARRPTVAIAALGGSAAPAVASMDLSSDGRPFAVARAEAREQGMTDVSWALWSAKDAPPPSPDGAAQERLRGQLHAARRAPA
ncbi:hypothetical protein JL721_13094 [Aureococcus anophagefferens]|nr:hypothetical protein JL721_13094 [Aureococcus anophagefferens]